MLIKDSKTPVDKIFIVTNVKLIDTFLLFGLLNLMKKPVVVENQ